MRKSLLILAAVAMGASLAVSAQNTGSVRYKWYDSQGLVHYSDSLTADAMKYGYDLVNDRGMVVSHVSRQLNPEERAAAAKLAEAEAAKISLQQTLDTVDQQIRTTRINLRSQEKALTDLLARAAEIENAKKPVPKFLTDSVAAQRNVVTALRATLQRQQTLRAQTVQEQVKQLARYRELKAQQDKASQ